MTQPVLPIILRILDNENRLSERADQKSISMLSIIGVFMVFFIVYYRVIPTNPLTVVLIILYFISALTAIINLIMAIRPRIKRQKATNGENKIELARDPAFFTGIAEFADVAAYKDSLQKTIQDESSISDVYIRQIYSVARINKAKYRYVQRGVVLAIVTLFIELVMITYLFTFYMGEGFTKMPPI